MTVMVCTGFKKTWKEDGAGTSSGCFRSNLSTGVHRHKPKQNLKGFRIPRNPNFKQYILIYFDFFFLLKENKGGGEEKQRKTEMCFDLQNLLPHWEGGNQTSTELQFQALKIIGGRRVIFRG